MPRQIALRRFGGPEVLEPMAAPDLPLRDGELRIRHTAIGVNFTDVHARRGDYAELHALTRPLVLGMEAVGIVEDTHDSRFRAGDRVAYASRPLGAYCEVRNFPATRCVAVPAGVADIELAACFLKGLTVQVLTRKVFDVKPGTWVVFHSAAGGVGALAGQWLRARGVHAIGIVGSESKAFSAKQNGYDHVFVAGRDDWPSRVRQLTGGGAPVVYDPVGQATWDGSIACLAPRGRMVCFGNSSGLVPPISVNVLRDRGSLSVTWARFGDYVANVDELDASARELFEALAAGAVRPTIQQAFPLTEAAAAHRLLESRQTTGSLVLMPSPGSA